jgi:hypothetical protein
MVNIMINDMIHDMHQHVKAFSWKNKRNRKFSFVEIFFFTKICWGFEGEALRKITTYSLWSPLPSAFKSTGSETHFALS